MVSMVESFAWKGSGQYRARRELEAHGLHAFAEGLNDSPQWPAQWAEEVADGGVFAFVTATSRHCECGP